MTNDEKGKSIVYQFFCNSIFNNILYSKGRFDRYDGIFTLGYKKYYFEVKYRLKHYSSLMLEKNKLDILSIIDDKDDCLYINVTPKDIYIFSLRQLQSLIDNNLIKSEKQYLPIDEDKINKKIKEVYNIPISYDIKQLFQNVQESN